MAKSRLIPPFYAQNDWQLGEPPASQQFGKTKIFSQTFNCPKAARLSQAIKRPVTVTTAVIGTKPKQSVAVKTLSENTQNALGGNP